MATTDSTKQTLAQMGVDSPTKVASLFDDLRSAFDRDVAHEISSLDLEAARVKWLGRKAGILAEIGDNWLKPAAKEIKPAVGQSLNALKAHVEGQFTALAAAKDTAREQSAAARANGTTYSQLIHGLKAGGIDLDRKILADMAVRDAEGFAALVTSAKQHMTAPPKASAKPAA